jgi:hypothetical protein
MTCSAGTGGVGATGSKLPEILAANLLVGAERLFGSEDTRLRLIAPRRCATNSRITQRQLIADVHAMALDVFFHCLARACAPSAPATPARCASRP